jgi:hypothetical protein
VKRALSQIPILAAQFLERRADISAVWTLRREVFEQFTRGKDGTAGFSAIWRADRQRIQRLQSIYYGGRNNRTLLQENFPANVEIQTEH